MQQFEIKRMRKKAEKEAILESKAMHGAQMPVHMSETGAPTTALEHQRLIAQVGVVYSQTVGCNALGPHVILRTGGGQKSRKGARQEVHQVRRFVPHICCVYTLHDHIYTSVCLGAATCAAERP